MWRQRGTNSCFNYGRKQNVKTNQSVHANGEVSPPRMSSLQAWGQKKAADTPADLEQSTSQSTLYCFSCATSPCACATPSKKKTRLGSHRSNTWLRWDARIVGPATNAGRSRAVVPNFTELSQFGTAGVHYSSTVLVETNVGRGTVTNGFSSGSFGGSEQIVVRKRFKTIMHGA